MHKVPVPVEKAIKLLKGLMVHYCNPCILIKQVVPCCCSAEERSKTRSPRAEQAPLLHNLNLHTFLNTVQTVTLHLTWERGVSSILLKYDRTGGSTLWEDKGTYILQTCLVGKGETRYLYSCLFWLRTCNNLGSFRFRFSNLLVFFSITKGRQLHTSKFSAVKLLFQPHRWCRERKKCISREKVVPDDVKMYATLCLLCWVSGTVVKY